MAPQVTLQLPWRDFFFNSYFYFLFVFLGGEITRAGVGYKGMGDEWDWGTRYEIHKESSLKRKEKGRLSLGSPQGQWVS